MHNLLRDRVNSVSPSLEEVANHMKMNSFVLDAPSSAGQVLSLLLLSVLFLSSQIAIAGGQAPSGLVRNTDGTVRPAQGYEWVDSADPKNVAVRVRPTLRIDHYDADGRTFFVPAGGFTWDGDPQKNDMAVRVKPGLVLAAVNTDGSSSFHPAPGYIWDGDPTLNDLAIKVRPELRVYRYGADGTAVSFVPAPGYDWYGNPKDLIVLRCDDFSGAWVLEGDKDLSPLIIDQAGCSFAGQVWNREATITHDITGIVSTGRMTVIRRAPGCTTEMYGRVFIGESGLWWSIDGTQGGCGIAGHNETRLFKRAPSFEAAFAAAPFIGRVVRGVLKSTRTASPENDMTHEPGKGPNPAALGGGGGRPATMSKGEPVLK